MRKVISAVGLILVLLTAAPAAGMELSTAPPI